jgi:23S rRNA (pseudouridine1915-N3)-methyltransferase
MKITLMVIGKNKDNYIAEGVRDYVKRMNKYVSFQFNEIPGVKSTKKYSIEEIKQREGEAILKYIPSNASLVLLDERGKSMNSEQFAGWLKKQMIQSTQHVIFLVGGAYGFSPQLYEKAVKKLSISPMTFSHQLIRLMFMEQIYRAFTIIHGEPYHHGNN